MTGPTLTLCNTCQGADPTLAQQLMDTLAEAGQNAKVQQVDCMSGCKRPQTLSLRQSGKTAYLFGEITSADLADIVTLVRLFADSPDGNFADARPLGALRMKAIARIPADIGAQAY
ncbi:putative metal-binding protein [Phaeobacter sp. CECT 5382]|uniref:DUF1636 family protein n=1 Tax=Phaeobacter sp. CECT 5382 TaxID=1712645 RepID=UPI0006DAF33A|nr:DUF1636 family protein [Phaeobacter sp. CECT 5382]CUH88029.1 putative metal-binding protein [Phaeobacter sp. CECT 5382]